MQTRSAPPVPPETATVKPQDAPSPYDLRGKTALVTGAGRGIGRRCAERLAEAGARVLAVARTGGDLETLAERHPGRIEPWAADVTAPSFPARIEALPGLDILVNNAGMNRPQPFEQVDLETLSAMMDLNIRAAFLVAQAATRAMLRCGSRGAIVNMSSQMGHVGSPNRAVYCMTKHAIEGLTRAMAVELAPKGIRVNAVAPTFLDTPMTRPMFEDAAFRRFVMERIPLGRLGDVEEVANAVLFLASPAAAMTTGDSLKVDGGWTAQ